jgi:hypothetical protein
MAWSEEVIWCDGCGVEISWGPVMVNDKPYCCQDCAQGYACDCGERMEMDEEMRSAGAESVLV